MYLARKFTFAKWEPQSQLAQGEIGADAVTVDLRTRENKLSFWRCNAGESSDVEEAALAIAAAGERIDKMDIVWLDHGDLDADGQILNETKGRTPVTDLADQHIDICGLDYVRLGKIADRVNSAINNSRRKRFTKSRVKKLLVKAVEKGRVNVEELSDKLRQEISA